MSDLTIFSFHDDESDQAVDVRTIKDDLGEPWFVARDVAVALGYARPSEAASSHCKYLKILKYADLASLNMPDPPTRGLGIIPESDVYRLVMRSDLESAERFQDWVVEEVLPSIRKTGSYSVQPMTPAEMFLKQAEIMVDHERRMAALEGQQQETREVQAQIQERLDAVELEHRNGVPMGYVSKKMAHQMHHSGLADKVFHEAMLAMGVTTEKYVHHGDGYQVSTYAYKQDELAPAVKKFIDSAVQVTPKMCASPYLVGRRFLFVKDYKATPQRSVVDVTRHKDIH